MARKIADCRDFPSDIGCTLTISGEEDEVLEAATQHAVSVHGHDDSVEVRDWLRQNLKDEAPIAT
jgi:predicted small metal-binding protein